MEPNFRIVRGKRAVTLPTKRARQPAKNRTPTGAGSVCNTKAQMFRQLEDIALQKHALLEALNAKVEQ